MGLLIVLIYLYLSIKFKIFLLRLCGAVLGGILMLLGALVLGFLMVFAFGFSLLLPLLLVAGVIAIVANFAD